MGGFYVNHSVRGVDQDALADYLEQLECDACVTPSSAGWTVVYDAASESQDDETIVDLGVAISARFRCVVFAALVHDGDVFVTWLFDAGKLVNRYDSAPGYFDGSPKPPAVAEAALLTRLLAPDADASAVERLLRAGNADAFDLHADLARALALSKYSLGLSYGAVIEVLDVEEGARGVQRLDDDVMDTLAPNVQ